MKSSLSRLLQAGAGLLVSVLAFPTLADFELNLDRRGSGELPVHYRDADNLRIGGQHMSSRYLTSQGKRYVLMSSADGKKQFAMDMDKFLAKADAPAAVEPDLDKLSATRTDREETIDGVTGQVYQVEAGSRSWELVLTEDETISAVTEAVYGAEILMARMSGQAVAAEPLAAELALAQSLGASGILRGQLYTLAAMRDVGALPDDQYQLAGDTLVISEWKEMQDAYH